MVSKHAYVSNKIGKWKFYGLLTVNFGACVDDTLGMMRKSGKVDTVLVALQFFGVLAFAAVVHLQRIIVACHNGKFARVVEIEGGDGSFGIVWPEQLAKNERLFPN
jgi:hypothetical protein